MRWVSLLLSLMVVVLIGTLALPAHPVAVAQEATPTAEEIVPEGVTFEPFGFVSGVTLPSPVDLTAAHTSFEPGASFSYEATDPQGAFVIVESGALTVRVEEISWTITRGSGSGEEIAPGEEATIEAGDSAYIPGGVTGEVRNNGQERAEALVFLVSPSDVMAVSTPGP